LENIDNNPAQRVRAEPGWQTVFGEFQAKNLASSSNEFRSFLGNETSNCDDWVAE